MTIKGIIAIAAFLFLGLSGCETIEGAGRDIENAGEAVTDTAQEAQY